MSGNDHAPRPVAILRAAGRGRITTKGGLLVEAVLLGRGPSVLGYVPERHPGALVVAVNGAAGDARVPCDWMAAKDFRPFKETTAAEPPRVGIICSDGRWAHLHTKEGKAACRLDYSACRLLSYDATLQCHPEITGSLSSGAMTLEVFGPTVTVALLACWHLGARSVVTYGVDFNGDIYADGQTWPSLTADRWRNESGIWAQAVRWMADRSIAVLRGAQRQPWRVRQ